MSINIDLGKWSSVFAIPTSVVDEDLKLASGKQLKVLLYILRNNNQTISESVIGKAVGMDDEDVEDAVNFWKQRGALMFTESSNTNQVISQTENIVTTQENVVITEEKKKPRPLTRVQKPDSAFVANRLSSDKELSSLLDEVQMIFGKPLSSGDTATLVMLHETDGLPCEVLLMLVNFCQSLGKGNMRYIEKVAVNWAAEDITTIERAEEKIMEMQKSNDAWNIAARVFGINNSGSPTKAQKENANRWINEWHFNEDLLREAYERCVNQKGSFSLTYINGILKNWNKNNINSIKELLDYDATLNADNKKTKNKNRNFGNKETSYDINKYENFSIFD